MNHNLCVCVCACVDIWLYVCPHKFWFVGPRRTARSFLCVPLGFAKSTWCYTEIQYNFSRVCRLAYRAETLLVLRNNAEGLPRPSSVWVQLVPWGISAFIFGLMCLFNLIMCSFKCVILWSRMTLQDLDLDTAGLWISVLGNDNQRDYWQSTCHLFLH